MNADVNLEFTSWILSTLLKPIETFTVFLMISPVASSTVTSGRSDLYPSRLLTLRIEHFFSSSPSQQSGTKLHFISIGIQDRSEQEQAGMSWVHTRLRQIAWTLPQTMVILQLSFYLLFDFYHLHQQFWGVYKISFWQIFLT